MFETEQNLNKDLFSESKIKIVLLMVNNIYEPQILYVYTVYLILRKHISHTLGYG